MTREEAIKEIIRAYDVLDFSCHMDNRRKEAFNMAKVALEQEPCIQEKQANADKIDAVYIDGFKAGYSQARFDLEQEPCGDAISRQAVLSKKIYTETENGWSGYTVDADYIENLPPVTQKPDNKYRKEAKTVEKQMVEVAEVKDRALDISENVSDKTI